ncbi:hypothetical protein [Salarchaeum japonicum]|uniref:Uncharacterized protein n=1 Tax=Salarchaeum japonicum TaxID=555573 RepID=A0AAV3T0B0_9EURY|nr:hypothetical protein [Salarchaeum japonicum]
MRGFASKVAVLLVVASALTMTGGYGTTASYLSDTETASGSIDAATGGDITLEKITPKKLNAKSNAKFTVHLDISGDASVRCGETTLRVLKTGDTITSLNQACDSSNAKFSRADLVDAVNGSGTYDVTVTVRFESGFTASATTTLDVQHASPGTQTVGGTNTGDDSGFTETDSDESRVVENETDRRNETKGNTSKQSDGERNASENTLNESESLENDSTPLENESESLENDTKSGDAGNESANAGEDADDGSTDGNADGGETRGENDGSGADAGDADAGESDGESDDAPGEESTAGGGAGSEDDGGGGGEQSGDDTERDDDDGGGGAS